MIIQLEKNLSVTDKQAILSKIADLKYKTREVKTQLGEYIIGLGKADIDVRDVGHIKGVADIHIVSDDFKLVSRKWKVHLSQIDLGDGVLIGDDHFALMAGPCSIEGEDQISDTIHHLKDNGVSIMRGGVYKPRSSPYSFRGLGLEGLKLWQGMAKSNGIKIVTEVMQVSQIEGMYDYVDVFQVGARNTQNYNLLDALGEVDKPVIIKRGVSGTVEELLYSAEYVFSGGNEKLMLCERGIRTYERASRNTMDLNAIPILKEKSHLPVIADPSHGIGIRRYVEPIALACVMAGADGLIYETHKKPEEAFSDGQQTLSFEESKAMIQRIKKSRELQQSFLFS